MVIGKIKMEYKTLIFRGEEFKQFESIEQAEEYRESLHRDDCMDNERLTRIPFLLDETTIDESTREKIQVEYMNYDLVRGNGCCGFMDEEIFIGNQMYMIGCNFGH